MNEAQRIAAAAIAKRIKRLMTEFVMATSAGKDGGERLCELPDGSKGTPAEAVRAWESVSE